ncbi:monocarboxylate transporter 9-like [Mizuhopecten yessoensis]|uniref:monocarboxylate transporter 9-like n=1 Tax=Mizuhopecten yessoensis TaxID=6573 RepID=UPI000B45D68B|nr:monocarboxylate transporter 9-like [Mizuhopecten yessoensis]
MKVVNNGENDVSENQANRDKIPKAIDGGFGWLVVLSSFMHNCLLDSVSFTFGIFYKDIKATFDDGSAKTQLLNSVIIGVALCTGPVSGALINRFDCRRVAISGGVVYSVGLFLSTFSPNLDVMILLYGVVAGFQVPYNFLPASVMEKGLSETDGALLISVLGIASTLSMVIAGLVADYPWADSILIYSVTLIIGGVATCFLPYYNDFSSLVIYSVVLGIPLEEKDGTTPFLDTLIAHKENGTIKLLVYCKPTHTDTYFTFKYHHPLHQKLGVVRTLPDRCNNTITEQDDKHREETHSTVVATNWSIKMVKRAVKEKTENRKPRQKKSNESQSKSKGCMGHYALREGVV